ncbi:MAG: MOSC domain-containing protein [Leptolyngbyaceae cyanobacterium MO_188.B28]|nr:MOSC domain-containing protein [Leptolyngbyaceae cyanobacterium MO_188.B28]
MAYIVQVSVSAGGVPKTAVAEAKVEVNGLVGDRQATPKIHGGPERAVCLWSQEMIDELRREGHPIAAGSAGENVTIAGLDWIQVTPGVKLKLGGDVLLEIAIYAAPCRKNARWFSNRRYSRISQKKYPGSSRLYARVLSGGMIRPSDAVEIL